MNLVMRHLIASRLITDLDGRSGRPLPEWDDELLLGADTGTATVALSDPTPPVHSLADVLRQRRAQRFYSSTPIQTGDLHAVCAAAAKDRSIGVLVAVRNVEGVTPGLHLYRDDTGSLTCLKEVPVDSREREGWFLQLEFTASPAVIVISGSIGAASLSAGSHGYRRLLVNGGAAAYRSWLTACRRGLVGSMFAGLLQPALREAIGVDGWDTAGLIGFSLGYPPDLPESD